MKEPDTLLVQSICNTIDARIKEKHIGYFSGSDKPLFLISQEYPGLWLEHVYDSVFYAKLYPEQIDLAINAVLTFIDHQTTEGQYPYCYKDYLKIGCNPEEAVGYSQIQECVSFAQLCYEVCIMANDPLLTEKIYDSVSRWDGWLRKHRMTLGYGLVEMFVGYDTGHDQSGRLQGLSCHGRYEIDGVPQNASILPPNDSVAPVIAVDMNANFYGTQMALSKLATLLGKKQEALEWEAKASLVKKHLLELCYDKEDDFFYDVDKHGNKRKYLSSTIFHLFQEKVLDLNTDQNLIQRIYTKHIKNPKEFWTPYPFPSMALCDPSCANHPTGNCWGYYSQALIALRCTRWMDDYGFSKDFDYLCNAWLTALTEHYADFKLGQELDPITGKPTNTSEWYSSCMLFYLYAAKRLNKR